MITDLLEIKTILRQTITRVSSGELTTGTWYRILENTTGDFTGVGADDSNVDTTFQATGTAPTWGDGILLQMEDDDFTIEALIENVEADYELIRNKPFQKLFGDITEDSAIIDNVTIYENLMTLEELKINETIYSVTYRDFVKVGQVISGTGIRGTVEIIDEDDSKITLSDTATETTEGVELTVYPKGAKRTIAKMIEWNMYADNGMHTERAGEWSGTKEGTIMGYPKSITGKISRHVRVV